MAYRVDKYKNENITLSRIDVNNYKLRDRNRNVEVIVDLENFIRQMYEAEKTDTVADLRGMGIEE